MREKHEVTEMEYGDYSNEFEDEAREQQAESDAQESCLEEARLMKAEGKNPACYHCGGCEGGKQLLQEIDEDRWQEEMRSAAEA